MHPAKKQLSSRSFERTELHPLYFRAIATNDAKDALEKRDKINTIYQVPGLLQYSRSQHRCGSV